MKLLARTRGKKKILASLVNHNTISVVLPDIAQLMSLKPERNLGLLEVLRLASWFAGVYQPLPVRFAEAPPICALIGYPVSPPLAPLRLPRL